MSFIMRFIYQRISFFFQSLFQCERFAIHCENIKKVDICSLFVIPLRGEVVFLFVFSFFFNFVLLPFFTQKIKYKIKFICSWALNYRSYCIKLISMNSKRNVEWKRGRQIESKSGMYNLIEHAEERWNGRSYHHCS